MKKHIVMTAATTPSANCWGVYRRVAVVLIDTKKLPDGCDQPKMISGRALGVIEVVRTWENQNVGTTDRCAYERAKKKAEVLARRLNLSLGVLSAEEQVEHDIQETNEGTGWVPLGWDKR